MTKTNEPLDPFKDNENRSDDSGSQTENEEWQKASPNNKESDESLSDDTETESVEEAFLALIQSNNAEELTSTDNSFLNEADTNPAMAFGESSEASFRMSEDQGSNVFPGSTNETAGLQPFGVDDDDGILQEKLAEEIFSDLPAEELPDVTKSDGQSVTDALSEQISESLAELQSGQKGQEPELISTGEELPELPQQPPVVPEFSKTNPLDGYVAPVSGSGNSPQDNTTQIRSFAAFEENFGKQNNISVQNEQHTPAVPFEGHNTNSQYDLNQIQDVQYASEFQNVGQASQPEASMHLDPAFQGGAKKTKADPEFQALVQWSNSDVEPSHHGPNDIPHFLSQKRVEESKFSFKTVFISIGISVVVIGMFYMGYQAGRIKDPSGGYDYDATANKQDDNGIVVEKSNDRVAENMFSSDNKSNVTRQPLIPPKPKASILEFSVANLSGLSGKTIPMNIKLEGDNLGLKTMLLFRGIPDEIALSKGLKREGLWSVPISDLGRLALVVPDNYKGRFDFEVFAFKDKESSPERRLASVSIEASQQLDAQISSVGSQSLQIQQKNNQQVQPVKKREFASLPSNNQNDRFQNQLGVEAKPKPKRVPPVVRKKVTPSISPQVEASMLRRGNQLLKNGDISGARLVFEHVAIQGSKHAAFALARTYDEKFLEQIYIRGIVPEMEMAMKWYKKAADLGHKEAVQRLRGLGQ